MRNKDSFYCMVALIFGFAIAYNDSGPRWDDTGKTVLFLFGFSCFPSLLAPRKAWLICILSGIWIPLYGNFNHHYSMVFVFAIPVIGSLVGWSIGRLLAKASPAAPDNSGR